jgi:hypothetical protein
MSTPAESIAVPANALARAAYRPPFIGIMAFAAALFIIPLAHALMVLTEYLFGEEHRYTAASVGLRSRMLASGCRLRACHDPGDAQPEKTLGARSVMRTAARTKALKGARLIATAGALALLTGSAVAADAPRPGREPASFGARDPGATRCGLLTKMQEKGPAGTELQFYTYAQAYFVGRLAGGPGGAQAPLASDGSARQRAYQTLIAYCEKHPSGTFLDAVTALWGDAGT